MKFLTTAEMREVDRTTIEGGRSSAQLMESAGAEVARFLRLQWPNARRVLVLCGKGNNGGDGLVAARHLLAQGMEVTCLLMLGGGELHGDAAEMLQRLSVKPMIATGADGFNSIEIDQAFAEADVVVDAVYGTGFRPPLDALTAAVKRKLDAMTVPVLAVDLPSGWDADARDAHVDAMRADALITFTAPKIAHAFGDLTSGPMVVASIGSPAALIKSQTRLTFSGSAKTKFERARDRDGNKGQYGHVLVVGGARGKAGAPSMASLAAMRAGAGLVTAAVAESILPTVARIAPELMTVALTETRDGSLEDANSTGSRWDALLEKKTVLAVGPGLGQSETTRQFVHTLVANTKLPLVLDADGLNAFDKSPEKLNGADRTLVLTPHPGEMAHLLGCTVPKVQADRENIARKFATEHELILVLKGWRTLIAHPDGTIAVNTTGNPGMAKGGSGDVLTGVIAGMLAQAKTYGANPAEAVEAAVYLHGLAADMAVAAGDEHTFLPTDLLAWLPRAFRFHSNNHARFAWLQGFPAEAVG